MTIKVLKQLMLLPKEEYIINKRVNIRGLNVQLMSFTVEEDRNRLWFIYEDKDLLDIDTEDPYWDNNEELKTNREEILRRLERDRINKHFHIRQLEIQGQTINFDSSSYSSLYNKSEEELMKLQHFAEKGLIPSEWDDIPLRGLVMGSFEQVKEEETPVIDDTKEISMKLYIDGSFKEIPIQHPFKVKFGKQEIDTKVKYFDPLLKQEKYFYIDEIYSFNPYEDIIQKVEGIEDAKMREDILKCYVEALESVCPKNKNLAVMKYETIDNIQLNFLMKDYLDSEPLRRCNSAASVGFISTSKEIGINGYKVRECVLQPIDKDFAGELEIELFSRYIEIPEEITIVR